MPAGNFSFNFASVKPKGWTASTIVAPKPSTVGDVNAAAQNPVTASALRTTPSTLTDPTLGSRQFNNPNTGIRMPVASASVYGQADVPAFLSQAVNSLNEEQALRRSLQAEWNNRIFGQASSGDPNAYLWQEAIRAASVSPGAGVTFGAPVMNPNPPRVGMVAPGVGVGSAGGGGIYTQAPLTVQQQITRAAADSAAANAWRNSASNTIYSPAGMPMQAPTTRWSGSGWV